MFWLLSALAGVGVIGAKYYTALGHRKLERRLNRVKNDLEKSRHRLKEEHEREESVAHDEEIAELRLRYMKELIEDLHLRLNTSDSDRKTAEKEEVAPLPSFMRT